MIYEESNIEIVKASKNGRFYIEPFCRCKSVYSVYNPTGNNYMVDAKGIICGQSKDWTAYSISFPFRNTKISEKRNYFEYERLEGKFKTLKEAADFIVAYSKF